MGVFDRAKAASGLSGEPGTGKPYICLDCEMRYEVQHHSCPNCGCYDIRVAKWVDGE